MTSSPTREPASAQIEQTVLIPIEDAELQGQLNVPAGAHGPEPGRLSPAAGLPTGRIRAVPAFAEPARTGRQGLHPAYRQGLIQGVTYG